MVRKHGYVPTLGVTCHMMSPYWQPYRSWRLGLYYIMLGFNKNSFSIFTKGKLRYEWKYYRNANPLVRMTTKDSNLRWSYTGESWKKENKGKINNDR